MKTKKAHSKKSKKTYATPKLSEWGHVDDLTGTGFTNPGTDFKGGSIVNTGKGS